MMKSRFLSVLLAVLTVTAPLLFRRHLKTVSSGAAYRPLAEITEASVAGEYLREFLKDGDENRHIDRSPFSEGEGEAALWIAGKFKELGLAAGLRNSPAAPEAKDYLMYFNSGGGVADEDTETKSQNVVGLLKGRDGTKRKLIIGANYDNAYSEGGGLFSVGVQTQGALDNASGVAVLLALVTALSGTEHEFDIIFTAFGANNSGGIGSAAFLSAYKDQVGRFDTILLAVDLEAVAGGDNLYVYCGEKEAYHGDYITGYAASAGLGLKAPPKNKKTVNVSTGYLPYSHRGLSNDNINFMFNGINTAYFFGYNWEQWKLGNNETSKGGALAGTESDTLEGLAAKYPDYESRMDDVVSIVSGAVGSEGFYGAMAAVTPYDYAAYYGRTLIYKIVGMVLIIIVIAVAVISYLRTRNRTPKQVFEKHTKRTAVFGSEYEDGGAAESEAERPDKNPFE